MPHENPPQPIPWDVVAITVAVGASVILDACGPNVVAENRSDFLGALFVAIVLGQSAFLVVWGAIGPWRLLIRWPLSLVAATAVACTLASALEHTDLARLFPRDLLDFLLLPILFLAAQLPIWGLQAVLGYRLVRQEYEDVGPPHQWRQFTLRHLLGLAIMVALAFGLASMAIRKHKPGPDAEVTASMWASLLARCGVCFLASLVVILPCIWAALIARNRLGAGFFVVALVVILAIAILGVLVIVVGTPRHLDELLYSVLALAGASAVLLGCLNLIRSCGWVLRGAQYVRPGTVPQSMTPLPQEHATTPIPVPGSPAQAANPGTPPADQL